MKTPINVARTKQWKLRVTLKGCCIVRARDDEQGSSSPVRYDATSKGHGTRAQGSTLPCVDAVRMWASGQGRRARRRPVADACGHQACCATARAATPSKQADARKAGATSARARAACVWPACVLLHEQSRGAKPRALDGAGRKPKCSSCYDCRVLNFNLRFSVHVILINFKINNLNCFLGF